MKTMLIFASLLTLSACASGLPSGDIASYDTLKVARDACLAKGGELVLTQEGNAKRVSAYVCEKK
jgi:uncharacterized lipoprotein YmbA